MYDRRTVEALAPAIWDDAYLVQGISTGVEVDPEMPKAPNVDPRRTNNVTAMIVDVREAWAHAELGSRMRQSLLLAYGFDEPRANIGRMLGVDKRTVQRDCEAGIGRMVDWLNGVDLLASE